MEKLRSGPNYDDCRKNQFGGLGCPLHGDSVLAFMVSGTKTQFANQLRAAEESLRGGKFPALGLQYTGDFMTDTSQPAATISQTGDKWNATNDDLTSTKGTLKTTETP